MPQLFPNKNLGRGKSVVDYIFVPQDYLDQCISFETITTRSIVEKGNLFNFLGERQTSGSFSLALLRVRRSYNILGPSR
ncbi:Hypothetical predicted protein [Mytilus galloprovincialis]|uniref:Uncharacterized protein n=1 Tax=Mytilus galloprovincialis TaxID=29158 RepID=A0A8B6HFR7_MYTGA|nr:Hypothetical predicted protein [Mytilus galloprovincialis]